MTNQTSSRYWLSASWGFAEATLFFILPDVLLSYFALDSKQRLIRLCCIALIGALLGGITMYLFGVYYPTTANQWVEAVPAINESLMQQVAAQMDENGILAILLGPLQGLPYKTFAVQASAQDIGIVEFVVISIPARLLRFLLVAGLARMVVMGLNKGLSRKQLVVLWAVSWLVAYTFYFYHFPS